jgi:methylated-DNA-[protein]-cysteine S-methyltransferase
VTSLTAGGRQLLLRSGCGVECQSSPKDVACGVFVCRCCVTAALAGEVRLSDAILARCVSAALTLVGSVPWVDLDPDTPSVFRFGAQYRDELAPASITDRTIEPGFRPRTIGQELPIVAGIRGGLGPAQHISDPKVLHHDQVLTGGDLARLFVVKVLAPVRDLPVPSADGFPTSSAVVGAALRPLQSLLACPQLRGGGARPPWILHRRAVGQCREHRDTDIDTRLLAGCRQRIGRDIVTRQDQHPAAALTFDLDRLYPALDLAMRCDLHVPDALQIHAVALCVPAGAITVLGPLHTVKPRRPLEPRKTGSLPRPPHDTPRRRKRRFNMSAPYPPGPTRPAKPGASLTPIRPTTKNRPSPWSLLMGTMQFRAVDSPVGLLTLAGKDGRLRHLRMVDQTYEPNHDGWEADDNAFPDAVEQLEAYFAGDRTDFDLNLDLIGTEFQRRVWAALLTIPYGETRSYGEIARQIGSPGAFRAVGLANGHNPIGIIVPCHRVIGSNGSLTGYGGGLDRKRALLEMEKNRISPIPTLFD